MRARSIVFLPFAVLLACGSDPTAARAAPEIGPQAAAPAPAAPAPEAPAAANGGPAIVVERLAEGAACDGVVPEVVPAPVDAGTAVPEGASCLAPTSDGTGAVALACLDATGGTTIRTFGPDGVARGSVAVGAPRSLEPQPRGFQAITEEDGAARFLVIRDDGALDRSEPVAPAELTLVDARLGPDPAGGGVVVARGTHTAGNHWFELLASRRDGAGAALSEGARVTNGSDPTSPMFFAGAVSTTGATLAVWGERGTTRFAWLDRDGAPLAGPSDEGPTDVLVGFGTPIELAPLLDGTVALRAGTEWRRAWAPSSPSGAAPPTWLATRPSTRVRHVRGSSAYALVPDPAATCTHRVELWNAAGDLCGAVTVMTGATSCPAAAVEVGRDGTLLAAPTPGTVRFWPSLLH